jgi:ABC-type transporter Mla subunit MlaD
MNENFDRPSNPNRKSITGRLTTLYTIAVLIWVVLTLIEQFINHRMLLKHSEDLHVLEIAEHQEVLSQQISKTALVFQWELNPTMRQQYVQELQTAIDRWSRSHQGLKRGDSQLGLPGVQSLEMRDLFAKIEPHYQGILNASQQILLAERVSGQTPENVPVEKSTQLKRSIEQILQNEPAFMATMAEIISEYQAEATAGYQRLEYTEWFINGLILLVMVLFVFPIQSVAKNLKSLIRQMEQSGIQVTASTTDLAASGRQLEAMMAEQIASTNEVVATSKEISATSEELVRTMDEVATMSEQTTSAANSGQQDLEKMEQTMRQLAEATASIATKLGAIGEKANNINTVVTTITKVADRTNLLSLNAAIEAEKAGEYGAGFAVVAREIRRLADQTAVATLDIEQMVKDMQGAVSSGVMEMDKFSKEVSLGVAEIRNITGKVTQIIQQVQSLTPRFHSVNQGMEVQSEGAGQINEAMIQLSEASQQTADALKDINRAVEQLNLAAQGLQQEIMNIS